MQGYCDASVAVQQAVQACARLSGHGSSPSDPPCICSCYSSSPSPRSAARPLPKALSPHPLLSCCLHPLQTLLRSLRRQVLAHLPLTPPSAPCRLHPLQTVLRSLRRSTARLFPASLLPTHIALPVDRAKEFEALNCQVLAASTDTEECHLAWIR